MPSIDRSGAYSGQSTGTDTVLSSDWTGLSPRLIASFFPVRRVVEGTATRWEREPRSVEVQAPLTDGMIEQTANWTSPFENQTPDAKLSSLSAMFQTGGFEAILNALQQAIGKDTFVGGKIGDATAQLQPLEGRTSVTKLNSTQVFTGMPPMRINVTAHFRANFNAVDEVEKPMQQLMAWAQPKKLAPQGVVSSLLDGKAKDLRSVYVSDAPQIIGMSYANMLIRPVVIESIPYPLTGPRDSNGHLLAGSMTLALATLTALDKDDWAGIFRF
jgi:hypothetical protein